MYNPPCEKRLRRILITLIKTIFLNYFHSQLRIPNLTMNEVYEVKVQAASLSIFNPPKLQIGESMKPRMVNELIL